jgi:NAD(P)-dependent dehydrogenase (short-subunit alcohol dehydrogenase family)
LNSRTPLTAALTSERVPGRFHFSGIERNFHVEGQGSHRDRIDLASPEQLGGTVAFLCSVAADQITGTAISVDGGWTAR